MTFKTLRRRAGFTQETLAKRARRGRTRLSQRAISKIENGEIRDPQYSTVMALAVALGLSAETVAASIRDTPRRGAGKVA